MMLKRFVRIVVTCAAILVVCAGLFVGIAYAQDPSSAHFQFIESDLGGGGLVPASSTNYQSVQSVNNTGVGTSSSSNFQFQGGTPTEKDPMLTLAILNNNATFNNLFSPSAASTATAEFSVVDYTSYGYAVQIVGNTPSNGNHSIPAMSDGSSGPTTSTPGFEQFGMNVVKNTSFCGVGCDVGADPNRGQFGASSAYANPTANFNTPNSFYYSSGDTIVQSTKSSGEIDYTISYVVNVSSLTPGGQYSSNESIICTGTY
jgi:hypothetical protein